MKVLIFVALLGCCFATQIVTFNCTEINNSNQVECNGTTYNWRMVPTVHTYTLDNCKYDPEYWNSNAFNCTTTDPDLIDVDNVNNWRVECPTHVNSVNLTLGCRLYAIYNKSMQYGVYNFSQNAVILSNGTAVEQCEVSRTNVYHPYWSTWNYNFHCASNATSYVYEVDCYNYERYYFNWVYCQSYELHQLILK